MQVSIALHFISITVNITLKPIQSDCQVVDWLVHLFKIFLWVINLDLMEIISRNSMLVLLLCILIEVNRWTYVCGFLNNHSLRMALHLISAVDQIVLKSTRDAKLTTNQSDGESKSTSDKLKSSTDRKIHLNRGYVFSRLTASTASTKRNMEPILPLQ